MTDNPRDGLSAEDRELAEWLGPDDELPSTDALAFADRVLGRASIQPARDAYEAARLSIAYEFDVALAAEGD